MELDPSVRDYYERGTEAERLFGGFPSGPLELARSKEIIQRYLPAEPLTILDVGGGPGVYAAWLAEQGHRVHVVDPIPLHVEQARAAHDSVSADVGDARSLTQPDESADAILLLGPLYHLVERADRMSALREAKRVLRARGMLFAAGISRHAALLDLLVRLDKLHEPGVMNIVEHAVETGVFRGGDAGLFTTAYFHRAPELQSEVTEAGFERCTVLQVEGPGFLVPDFERRWNDDARREAMLRAARLIETDPETLAVSSHLLAVARAPE